MSMMDIVEEMNWAFNDEDSAPPSAASPTTISYSASCC